MGYHLLRFTLAGLRGAHRAHDPAAGFFGRLFRARGPGETRDRIGG